MSLPEMQRQVTENGSQSHPAHLYPDIDNFINESRSRQNAASKPADQSEQRGDVPECGPICQIKTKANGIMSRAESKTNIFFHEVTRNPLHNHINGCSLFTTFLNILGYFWDIGTDVAVAYVLWRGGDHWWFGLTVGVTIVSLIIANLFSLHWYYHDYHLTGSDAGERAREVRNKEKHKASYCTVLIRILSHLLLMGPVYRMCSMMHYARKTIQTQNKVDRKERKGAEDQVDRYKGLASDYYILYVQEDRDVSLLELMLAFLQDAPQLVLQIYILLLRPQDYNEPVTIAVQVVSIVTSLYSKSWSLAAYHRALRYSLLDKSNLSLGGTIMHFIWRLGTITSRVLAFALFAKIYKEYFIYGFLAHWGLMTLWIMCQRTTFCDTATGEHRFLQESVFNVIFGFVNTFCFFNVKDTPTRYRISFYYFLVFGENMAMVVLWYMAEDPSWWYHVPGLVAVPFSFFIGMVFMISYYRCCHPNVGKTESETELSAPC